MSVVIETLVCCDGCGHNNSGDDRHLPAYEIRKNRAKEGWRKIGQKDYCPKCVESLKDEGGK